MAPEQLQPEIRAGIDEVDRMDAMTDDVGSAYMSKMSRSSYHVMSRKRGRTSASHRQAQDGADEADTASST